MAPTVRKIGLKRSSCLLILFFFTFTSIPVNSQAADLTAPDQTTQPQQPGVSPDSLPPSGETISQQTDQTGIPSLQTLDSTPLSAPSLTENDIVTNGNQDAATITAQGTTAITVVQTKLNALMQQYKGTALEKITSDLQQGLIDTNNTVVIPQTTRASDLLKTINSTAETYDSKLSALTELDGIRDNFESGSAAKQIQSLRDDTQYIEDTGNILSPLWDQAKTAYSDLLKSGSDFKTQTAPLLAQLKAAPQGNNVNLLAGLSNDIAKVDTDLAEAKAILDSDLGTRNPNDVTARLKLLTDAVTNDMNFYTSQIAYYSSEIVYSNNMNDTLASLWGQANTAYSGLLAAGANFKTQAASLTLQLNSLAKEYSSIPAMQNEIPPMLKGLSDDIARVDTDAATAKALLDSTLGSLNPSDATARLKLLTDAVTADNDYYAGQITYYTNQLAYCEDKATQLGGMLTQGQQILSALNTQSAALLLQITAISTDLAKLKKTQANNSSLINFESRLTDLKAQITANAAKAQSIYQDMLTRRSPGEIKSLLDQLQGTAKLFDPNNATGFTPAVAALKTELGGYLNLTSAMDTAKKLAASIQLDPILKRLDSLTSDFKSLGNVSSFPESKEISSELALFSAEVKADKTKIDDLLKKILSSTNPAEIQKMLAQMQTITLKYSHSPAQKDPKTYYQRMRDLRKKIETLRLKKLTQKIIPFKK